MVDFEWYRSFVAIYKHNSVSEAAKTRMMTQPAMSQHLASLEAEVGEALFVRTARKLVPTERGKELYSQVAPLIETLEETTVRLKSSSLLTHKVVRIGAASEFYQYRILPQLHRFGTCTVSYFGTTDRLLELLKDDQVDLIVASKKYLEPGIEYVKLCDEQFVVIAPASAEAPQLNGPAEIDRWLCSQRWISYGPELPIIRRFWREHFKKRPLIKPVHIIPNLQMILMAVANGEGVSLVPTYMLEHPATGGVRVLFRDWAVRNELFLAFKMKNRHLPLLNEVMDKMREWC